jgi:hypothetical protein
MLLPGTTQGESDPFAPTHWSVIFAAGPALRDLPHLLRTPASGITPGQLRFDPIWEPIRGDPRFEKIVASLAPK